MNDDAEEPTIDDAYAQLVDLETQKRLWIRTLIPLVQHRSADTDPSGRVQFALDMMVVAAAEKNPRPLCGRSAKIEAPPTLAGQGLFARHRASSLRWFAVLPEHWLPRRRLRHWLVSQPAGLRGQLAVDI